MSNIQWNFALSVTCCYIVQSVIVWFLAKSFYCPWWETNVINYSCSMYEEWWVLIHLHNLYKILKMFCNTPLRSLRDDATCVRMFSSGSHKTLTGPTFTLICFLTEPTQILSFALFAFSGIRLEQRKYRCLYFQLFNTTLLNQIFSPYKNVFCQWQGSSRAEVTFSQPISRG